MSGLEFDVFDVPAPQGSKRHVGNGVMVESSKKVKPWRESVRVAALDAMGGYDVRHQLAGPVTVWVVFHLRRPKGHYRTGVNSALLRPSAPKYPGVRPDLDKLVRSTLDALTSAGVFGDDSQVVNLIARKRYAGAPGASIHVTCTADTEET